jgi:hypothetical protein
VGIGLQLLHVSPKDREFLVTAITWRRRIRGKGMASVWGRVPAKRARW